MNQPAEKEYRVESRCELKVLVIDPAGYSPPYDRGLRDGLLKHGVRVRLMLPSAVMTLWENYDAVPLPNDSGVSLAWRKLRNAVGYLSCICRSAWTIVRWRPDVVHFQWLPFPLIDAALVLFASKFSTIVYTMHNVVSSHEPSHGFRGIRKRGVIARFDKVIVHSSFSARSIELSNSIDPSRLRVIPHGSLDVYRRIATVRRDSGPVVRILFFGSIKPYKGLDVLVESLKEMPRDGTWHLTIAGSPNYPINRHIERVQELGFHSSVNWVARHLSERELANQLTAAHVVVLPYREIDQSGVLMAAIGAGRAVVVTDVGAFTETIQGGVHGLVVEPGDARAFGQALRRMTEDSEFRDRCEEGMRVLSDATLSWDIVAMRCRALYLEAESGGNSS